MEWLRLVPARRRTGIVMLATLAVALRPTCHAAAPLHRRTEIDLRELAARRRVRTLGVGSGCVLVAAGLAAGDRTAVFDGAVSRAAAEQAPATVLAVVAGAATWLAWTAFRVWQDRVALGPPALGLGTAQVAAAPQGRGEGLFAKSPLPCGAFIGRYPGQLLTEEDLVHRYPDGLTEYVFGLPGNLFLDADPRYHDEDQGEREAWSGAVHKMNHAPLGVANVERDVLHVPMWPGGTSVRFFALRPICAGEELRFDYGPDYNWEARGIQPVV